MFVSTLGSHAAGIVYPLLVLALTGSPEIVGWEAALCGVMIERLGAGRTLAFFACVFALLALAALSSRTIRHEPTLPSG